MKQFIKRLVRLWKKDGWVPKWNVKGFWEIHHLISGEMSYPYYSRQDAQAECDKRNAD